MNNESGSNTDFGARDKREEDFLKSLEETLQHSAEILNTRFLLLQAKQVNYLAFRLHDALDPKKDIQTNLIQAWTIQSDITMKTKTPSHLQVLKLSTMLREVQCLRITKISNHSGPIQLEIFPSLRSIEMSESETSNLQNLHFFCHQLELLQIEDSVVSQMAPILSTGNRGEKEENEWRCLKNLRIRNCQLLTVDSSLNLAKFLRSADFSNNKIVTISSKLICPSLVSLNLSYNKLISLREIHITSMPSLKQLDVSHNDLTVLESNLSTLSRLQQLTLSFNKLQNIQDIHFLQPLTKLRILALEGNPLTRRPDYRREVFLFLGERLELDQLPWSYAEIMSMERSRILGKRLEEKNDGNMWKNAVHVVNSATVSSHQRSTIAIIYPKLDPGNIKPCTAGIVKIANPSNGNITKQLLSSVSLSLTPKVERDKESQLGKYIGNSNCRAKTIRTVDDFFRGEEDSDEDAADNGFLDHSENECAYEDRDESSIDEESMPHSFAEEKQARSRSRKYTTSDFTRDVKEEECQLQALSPLLDNSSPPLKMRIQSRKNKQGKTTVNVLLNAEEASTYDIVFGRDGAIAELEIKTHEICEQLRFAEPKATPIVIHRRLTDILALSCILSHAMKSHLLLIKLKKNALDTKDVTYKINQIEIFEKLLNVCSLNLQHVQKQHLQQLIMYICASCGAYAQVTKEFMSYDSCPFTTDITIIYACLFCGSRNIRVITSEKMINLFAFEGINLHTIRSSRLLDGENDQDENVHVSGNTARLHKHQQGFYIEENMIEGSQNHEMYECVMMSNNGHLRELMIPFSTWKELQEEKKIHHESFWKNLDML